MARQTRFPGAALLAGLALFGVGRAADAQEAPSAERAAPTDDDHESHDAPSAPDTHDAARGRRAEKLAKLRAKLEALRAERDALPEPARPRLSPEMRRHLFRQHVLPRLFEQRGRREPPPGARHRGPRPSIAPIVPRRLPPRVAPRAQAPRSRA